MYIKILLYCNKQSFLTYCMLDLFSKALQCILPFWTWGRPFCTPPLLLRLWLVLCLHSHCDAVLQGTVCKNKQPINHSPKTKCLIIVFKICSTCTTFPWKGTLHFWVWSRGSGCGKPLVMKFENGDSASPHLWEPSCCIGLFQPCGLPATLHSHVLYNHTFSLQCKWWNHKLIWLLILLE